MAEQGQKPPGPGTAGGGGGGQGGRVRCTRSLSPVFLPLQSGGEQCPRELWGRSLSTCGGNGLPSCLAGPGEASLGVPRPSQGRWQVTFPRATQQVPWGTRCRAVGRQPFVPSLAGKASAAGAGLGKGGTGHPPNPQQDEPTGAGAPPPSGPAVPSPSREGRGRAERSGGWGAARGEAGPWRQKLAPHPSFCHYLCLLRERRRPLGSQQRCLLVSPFPSGPSASRRPSCAWPTAGAHSQLPHVASCGPEAPGDGGLSIHTPLARAKGHTREKQRPLWRGEGLWPWARAGWRPASV